LKARIIFEHDSSAQKALLPIQMLFIDFKIFHLHMYRSRQATLLTHILGWLIFYAMVLIFVTRSARDISLSWFFGPDFLLFYFIFPFLFYLNLYVLLPKLLFPKKYFLYIAIALLLFILVYWLQPFDKLMSMGRPQMDPPPFNDNGPGFRQHPDRREGHIDIMSIVLFILVWSVSTAVAIFERWRISEKRALQAETEKANAELSFLKAQINPHFLFNTLNNIYSLVVTRDEKAAGGIMKLSNIMRYITDDVTEDTVSLEKEIGCMRDYIDLQKMRLGSKTDVDLRIDGNTTDKEIAPLLLMTFIENAFKYGTSNHEPSSIIIKLTIAGNRINFFCENKLFDVKRNPERAGIGIQNAKKRLAHLYPGKHSLEINSTNGLFTVQLTLQA